MERTEVLFAHWAVRFLKGARGPKWKRLVEQVAVLPETHPDALAFQLMMVRLNGCLTCDARKYAERGGCVRSSLTSLGLSKETDESLVARFRAARKEVLQYLKETERTLQAA